MTKKKNAAQEALEQQIAELTEALQRERADIINIRQRHERDLLNITRDAKVSVTSKLIPVIDNFERALKHTPKHLENDEYVKGVQGVVKQFEKTLEDLGVERIKTVGEVFDPHLHEAVSMEDAGGQIEVICEELQPGYKIGDEVIRHAMVRVKMENKA